MQISQDLSSFRVIGAKDLEEQQIKRFLWLALGSATL